MRDPIVFDARVADHYEMRQRIKKEFDRQYDLLMKPEIHEADCLVLDCPTGCFKRVPDKVVSEPYSVRVQETFEISGDEIIAEQPKKKPRYTAEQIEVLTEMMRSDRPINEIDQKRKQFENL